MHFFPPKKELLDGKEIVIGGKTYIAPPLNFAAIRRLEPAFQIITTGDHLQAMDGAVQIIHAALVRNYPRLSVRKLHKALTIATATAALRTIMEVSGFTQGEQKAAASQ